MYAGLRLLDTRSPPARAEPLEPRCCVTPRAEAMPPPRLALFLNPWGASSFSRHLPTLLSEARKRGYDGVEMSLSDLGADPAARRATSDMIAEHGMRLILGLYSGWDDYEGPWTPSSPGAHVSQLEEQLKQER